MQFGHDTAAVMLRDGRVASFVLRERLGRIKPTMSLDWTTVERALSDAGIVENDMDYCAITPTQETEMIARDPKRISVNLDRHTGHMAPCSFADIVARDYSRFHETAVIRHGFHYPATLTLNGRRIPASEPVMMKTGSKVPCGATVID